MELLKVLKSAFDRLRSDILKNEAQVKQSIIVPVLRALDWDDSDPTELVPEFKVSNGGSVDYALLRSSDRKPLVFIEAKRLGNADEKGEKQLFDYAANRGVPLLILTDGGVWDFYLSMAEGVRAERRFYHADLRREENIPDYARYFVDYLRKDRVVSGQAQRKADERHQSNREKNKARNAIPGVWQDMLAEPDEMLRELLVEAVESKCGTKPELDDVEAFLAKQIASSPQISPAANALSSPSPRQASAKSQPPRSPINNQDQKPRLKIVGFVLFKEETPCGYGGNTLAEVLNAFQRRDPEFMSRFAAHPVSKRRTRRLVAESRDDLYNKSHLIDFSIELADGWWLGSNLSANDIRRRIQIACEIAGVKFGSELTLIEQ